ncbi:flagellar motor protein MotB [Nocardioides perillae]|uniref:Chemotaxis protein MotB n=1 Tax=Nocardioides perillae TaxID=1119534 RepID=A0A7Y9UT16_9ACTN|nr:chemotaxis protein MotB [Nocardioides perillae]
MSGHGGGGRRPKKHDEEEHENHERWLVTYADMVTLLMVLFIVMFAMSSVDQKKFNELKSGLAAGFGDSTSVLVGSESILDQPGSAGIESFTPSTTTGMSPRESQLVDEAVNTAAAQAAQRQYAEAAAEAGRLEEVAERVGKALREHGLGDDVQATIDERGLVLSLVSKHVVFEPNLASLSPRGREVVDTLAPVLRDLPDPLQVDGHTNQVKVKPKYYPTDWELSAARAVTVLRHLTEQWDLPPARLRASAYGAEKPLVDPREPGSQAVNKRVDIVVLSDVPPEVRALLDDVVRDRVTRAATRPAPGTEEAAERAAQTTDTETTETTETADAAEHAEGAH